MCVGLLVQWTMKQARERKDILRTAAAYCESMLLRQHMVPLGLQLEPSYGCPHSIPKLLTCNFHHHLPTTRMLVEEGSHIIHLHAILPLYTILDTLKSRECGQLALHPKARVRLHLAADSHPAVFGCGVLLHLFKLNLLHLCLLCLHHILPCSLLLLRL